MLREASYVFEPVIEVTARQPLGYEALLRLPRGTDFRDATDVFVRSRRLGVARALDEVATAKAIEEFREVVPQHGSMLFYNLHNLALDEPIRWWHRGRRRPVDAAADHPSPPVCIEISEQTPIDRDRFDRYLDSWPTRPRVALDDFGVGHSAISRLVSFEPDFVKIDRLFVQRIVEDAKALSRLARIVDLIHDSDAAVIVEGVESEAAFDLCRRIGCDYAQGYLFGTALTPVRPM